MKQYYMVIFDDHCLMCSKAVDFIIKRDRKKLFLFTGLKSPLAQTLMKRCHGVTPKNDTIVVIKGHYCYCKSDAVIEIAKELGIWWSWVRYFAWIPKRFRNAIYDFIAKHRYRFFGRSQQCLQPRDDTKERFKY